MATFVVMKFAEETSWTSYKIGYVDLMIEHHLKLRDFPFLQRI